MSATQIGTVAEADSSADDYVVEMQGIVKRFPGVLANDGVDFLLRKGEIHALLGENGAGKTTLMNILYGLYQADSGEIYVKGEKVHFQSPVDAIDKGMGMVHQHFTLVNSFTVTQNIILGLKNSGIFIDRVEAEKRVIEISQKFGLKADPRAKVWQLSVGERQRIEVLRSLYRGADILVLDEPTSVLTPPEVKEFFDAVRSMASKGNSVIFITHKLHEVMAISNRVTVLRGGRVMGTVDTAKTNEGELAKMMIGRELKQLTPSPVPLGEGVLTVDSLWVTGDKGNLAVKDLRLSVRKSEILGIAGVAGNGQRELAEAIACLRPVKSGRILMDGHDVTGATPREAIKQGLAYIPEDRLRVGLLLDMTVAENLILEQHSEPPFGKSLLLDRAAIDSYAEKLVREYDIKTPSTRALAKTLSGGNLQKLIVARELSRKPKLIVASNPTKGLDIGATEFVRSKLIEAKQDGVAILLISEDLDEVLQLSDKVSVVYEGRIMDTVKRENLDLQKVGLMMGGVTTT